MMTFFVFSRKERESVMSDKKKEKKDVDETRRPILRKDQIGDGECVRDEEGPGPGRGLGLSKFSDFLKRRRGKGRGRGRGRGPGRGLGPK